MNAALTISVVTLFPQMLEALSGFGVTGRAIETGKVSVETVNPRDFADDVHRSVDDRPFGGGPGMVMKFAPCVAAIRAARAENPEALRVALSPQGRPLTQQTLARYAGLPGLILVAGRYEGFDERIIEAEIDEELSLGDFVLSGGELAALAVIDGVVRLRPGVLGHSESAVQDSFSNGLLDYPHYTRPPEIEGREVPAVLQSGDHAKIARWRRQQALGRTIERRPELIDESALSEQDRQLLAEYRRSR